MSMHSSDELVGRNARRRRGGWRRETATNALLAHSGSGNDSYTRLYYPQMDPRVRARTSRLLVQLAPKQGT